MEPVAAFKALYGGHHIREVMDLDIMHPSITWTRVINDGIEQLCDYVLMEAEEIEDDAAMKMAGACKLRHVRRLKSKLADERVKQDQRRH